MSATGERPFREPGGEVSVLLVDDDPSFADVAATFLEREADSMRVVTEESADAGLARLEEVDVDCVVSDYQMPGTDGLEFLEAVRERHPDLPFILFTGKGSEEIASEAISRGVTDYLQKGGAERYTLLANRIGNAVARHRAEQAAREREELFGRLLEGSTDIIAVIDNDGVVQYASPAVEHVLGYDADELVGESAFEFVHPEDRDAVVETFFAAAEDPEGVPTAEYRFRHADGSWRWLESHGSDRIDHRGLTGFIVNARDVTDRKERKRELQRYETVVETVSDGICMLDMEGNVVEINDYVVESTGYDREELVGDHISKIVAAESVERGAAAIERLLTGDEEIATLEQTVVTADGEEIPVESRISLLYDGDTADAAVASVRDISGRKARERELERYETMVETVSDGVYALDEDGRYTYVNSYIEDMVGYDREDIVGEHASMFLDEADVERFESAIREMLRGEREAAAFELDVRTAEDDRIPAEARLTLLPVDDGAFRGTVGVLRDVSDHREREHTLEALHDVATDIEACDTVDAVCERTITAAEELLSFDICVVNIEEDGMLPIRAISEDMPPEGATTMSVDEGIAGKTYRTGESFLVDDIRTLDEAKPQGPYRSALSIPVGEHGVFQTVSDEPDFFDEDDLELAQLLVAHTAEALSRIEREEALRAERDRFAALFEMIPESVVHVGIEDDEPVIRDVNSAFQETFGYDADAVVGESLNDVVVPEGAEDEAAVIDERARSGEVLHRAVRRQTADGVREFLFRSAPVGGADGDAQFGIYIDVTEQKRRELQLQRQNERLEEFASVVSHDLRNPLNVAEGRLELGLESGEEEHFRKAREALGRMDGLIEDVLALARQGEVVSEPATVDLAEVVELACTTTGLGERVVAGDLPAVEGDEERLCALFENLFRNAVEHGGPDVTVTVGATEEGFYVADDGPGIPEDEREAVFEAGYSTGDDGTGFGLNIVERIVEAHGWSISVGRSDAGGARFDVDCT